MMSSRLADVVVVLRVRNLLALVRDATAPASSS
jgi:hypothetical protein